MNVLVIDDNRSFVAAMAAVIRAWGADADSARTAEEGLQRVREHAYDFILLDLQLPEHDGLWFLEQARLGWKTKVVIVSGFIPVPIMRNLGRWGISDALVKPFSVDDLFACFGSLLNLHAPG